MNQIEHHEQLKTCAIFSYNTNNLLPKNFKLIGLMDNNKNGLQASIVKNGNEIIIAFRGTNFEFSKEGYQDGKMITKCGWLYKNVLPALR